LIKEMALLAIQLQEPTVIENEEEVTNFSTDARSSDGILRDREEARKEREVSLFDQELASLMKMVSSGRRASNCQPDEFERFLDQMIDDGFEGDDLAERVESFENLMQYDESGAVIIMSAHERTIACGRLDSELTAEDLPAQAQHLAAELRRNYANGKPIDEIWDEINAQLEILFPVCANLDPPKDHFPTNLTTGCVDPAAIHRRPRFFSHANRELQSFCREVLEEILSECQADFHMTALRNNRVYREFH